MIKLTKHITQFKSVEAYAVCACDYAVGCTTTCGCVSCGCSPGSYQANVGFDGSRQAIYNSNYEVNKHAGGSGNTANRRA